MTELQHQVTIHIVSQPLQFKNTEDLVAYVRLQRAQGGLDDVGQPVWRKYEHFPLLKIIDDRRGRNGLEYKFKTEDDLPKESLMGVTGNPLILIG